MDRRTLIKRAGAAGAVAWTAPLVLDSLASPAAAQTAGTSTLYLRDAATVLPGSLQTTQGAALATKTIAKDGAAVNAQTDTTKYHVWQITVPAGGMELTGAQLLLWTTGSSHVVTAGLFACTDCSVAADSNSCTLLSTATSGAAAGSGLKTITFTVNTTLTAGQCLRVKVINRDNVSANDFVARWNSTVGNTADSRLVLTH